MLFFFTQESSPWFLSSLLVSVLLGEVLSIAMVSVSDMALLLPLVSISGNFSSSVSKAVASFKVSWHGIKYQYIICCFKILFFYIALIIIHMKLINLEKKSLGSKICMGNIAAAVLLKLFIIGNER